MFDLHAEFMTFYREHVRLGKARRDDLAKSRDNNMLRLANGLKLLGHPIWVDYINQGGYAMHTLNQAVGNNYDIDVALIFEAADLPASALAARQRIRAGLIKNGGQFSEDPTARTNAVTVWYQSGEHLDFAIFRRRKDLRGFLVSEHASGEEWRWRDPEVVTAWLNKEVLTRSPGEEQGATVLPQQLRRIVRFVKFLTRARTGWSLPGGMIITALVCEPGVYRPHLHRDDVALYQTLQALRFRLAAGAAVIHPTDGTHLTEKPQRALEVNYLKELLDDLMPKLVVLEAPSCTRAQARNAWRQFFNHEYWEAANDVGKPMQKTAAAVTPVLSFGGTPRVPVKEVGFG